MIKKINKSVQLMRSHNALKKPHVQNNLSPFAVIVLNVFFPQYKVLKAMS